MPRRSSEDLAAEMWRSQTLRALPPVPSHLKGVARQVYAEIVAHYPPERFQGGANCILEMFAHATACLRRLTPKLGELEPGSVAYGRTLRQITQLTQVQLSSAIRLRLTPSTRWRADDGRLDERGAPRSKLLGGGQIRN
jgi:hypothetical protein